MEQLPVDEIEIKVESYIENNPNVKEGFSSLQAPEKKSFKDGLGILFKIRHGAVGMLDQDSKVLMGIDAADQSFRESVQDHIKTYDTYDLNQDGGPNWLDTTATVLFKLVQGQNQSDYTGQRDRVFGEAYTLRQSLHRSGILYEDIVSRDSKISDQTNEYLNTVRPKDLAQIDGYYNEFDGVLNGVRHPSKREPAEE